MFKIVKIYSWIFPMKTDAMLGFKDTSNLDMKNKVSRGDKGFEEKIIKETNLIYLKDSNNININFNSYNFILIVIYWWRLFTSDISFLIKLKNTTIHLIAFILTVTLPVTPLIHTHTSTQITGELVLLALCKGEFYAVFLLYGATISCNHPCMLSYRVKLGAERGKCARISLILNVPLLFSPFNDPAWWTRHHFSSIVMLLA